MNGEVRVTQLELIELGSGDLNYLFLLKDKGVPLDGTVYPRMKKGFVYTTYQEPSTGDYVISWEEEK